MAGDDLETPLGVTEKHTRRSVPIGLPVAVLLGLCLLTFVGWALVANDPFGGEPQVIVKLGPAPASGDKAGGAPTPSKEPSGPAPAGDDKPAAKPGDGQTVTIIDGSTGKRQEVRVPGGGGEADPAKVAAIDTHLLEATRHGQVPRISLDGLRPSAAYARPATRAPGARVAIVVGGLGVSPTATTDAIRKLPAAVTLAFMPYGTDLDRLVSQARADKHEVLLQLPMEPFDYPDNDPGPQTLLTTLAPEQNIDRMQWSMSRIQGYVGVLNFMGGRFTSTEGAIAPVLRELAKRGLIYVDDGASPRSLAGQIAGANNLPFAKGTIVLDDVPSAAEIERAFTRLEAAARESGSAVAVARALPLSIERIAQWSKQAESRGIVLVPITTLAVKAKAS